MADGELGRAERSSRIKRYKREDQSYQAISFYESSLLRGILGDPAVDAVVAVRRYEQENFADLAPDELAQKFRMAWSV